MRLLTNEELDKFCGGSRMRIIPFWSNGGYYCGFKCVVFKIINKYFKRK